MMSGALGAIFRAETKLLARNSAVAVSAVLVPAAMGVLFLNADDLLPGAGTSFLVTLMLLTVFGMSGCITAAASLSYRRDELYLKRLRSGNASDTTVLLGVLSPAIGVTLAQSVLMVVLVGTIASMLPTNPLLLLAVIVLGAALSIGLGMAVTGITSSSEQAQTVATPVVFALLGSGFWAGMSLTEGLSTLQLALPGGAVAELLRLAYSETSTFTGQLAEGLPALGVLAAWTVLALSAARRLFRWEPRQ
ncbi:ABC transporter permease [Prauserella cavernicola]|uniref:ABC transporter permease n=1 Tax=Prauserella cavernicola TaxID=2800127 RepID=A0A934QU22_9PSEU|nr:ABC transporter permease [Prauserella cavernicola]MBK1786302.1 ABC transporter permease [Prauserella cavernicola]